LEGELDKTKFSRETNGNDRALGTALDWPDAKKRAHQVREWGIKVGEMKMSDMSGKSWASF
jgi:hypothetical protein